MDRGGNSDKARLRDRAVALLAALLGDRRGGTAIEYGLILALVVITMIAALVSLADTTTGMWNGISANVQAAH